MRRRAGSMHSMASMSQQWKRLTSWFGAESRAVQIGLGCGVAMAMCACSAIGLAVLASIGILALAVPSGNPTYSSNVVPSSGTATGTIFYPIGTLTLTPRASQSSGPALLGGSGQAFIDQYGPLTSQSNASAGDLHFRQYPGVAQDFLIVGLGSRFGITPGAQNAASILAAAPPGQPWTMSKAQAQCAVFLPRDAKLLRTVPVPASHSVDYIYHSDTLAQVFPASTFQDANLSQTTPGTFDANYLYASANASDQIDSCDLELGSQQSQ